MRILLAEDEKKIAEHIRFGLVAEGYAVDVAGDGDEAIWLAESSTYDAMLLDINIPHKDGITIMRFLRRKGVLTPVIFLTGFDDIEDKVRALDAGADDYLTKPFSIVELLARLRAVLRRQRPQATNLVKVADLELDLVTHEARRAGGQIILTRREFALLDLLISSSPRTVSKTVIIEKVWDQHFDSGTNVVNVFIKGLRRKIDLPGLAPLIHTVRGVGFALRVEGG